jgi:hypothetical protein
MTSVLLPLLAVAWLNAAASPCAGMASELAVIESGEQSGAHHGHPGAEHHTSGASDHEHFEAADHSARSHGHSTPMHDHGDCPHCPATAAEQLGSTPQHVVCDTAQSAADKARSGAVAAWDLKHALPMLARLVPETAAPPGRLLRAVAQAPPASPRLPLNVRYCVFLI